MQMRLPSRRRADDLHALDRGYGRNGRAQEEQTLNFDMLQNAAQNPLLERFEV